MRNFFFQLFFWETNENHCFYREIFDKHQLTVYSKGTYRNWKIFYDELGAIPL